MSLRGLRSAENHDRVCGARRDLISRRPVPNVRPCGANSGPAAPGGDGRRRHIFLRGEDKPMASAPSETVLTWLGHGLCARASMVKSRSAGLSSTSRISAVPCHHAGSCLSASFPAGKVNLKMVPPPSSGHGLNCASVPFDDLLADRQPDAVAGIFGAGVQAVENDEDASRRARRICRCRCRPPRISIRRLASPPRC